MAAARTEEQFGRKFRQRASVEDEINVKMFSVERIIERFAEPGAVGQHGINDIDAAAWRRAGAAHRSGIQWNNRAAERGDSEGKSLQKSDAGEGAGHVREAVSGEQHGAGDRPVQNIDEARPAKSAVQGDVHLPGQFK